MNLDLGRPGEPRYVAVLVGFCTGVWRIVETHNPFDGLAVGLLVGVVCFYGATWWERRHRG